MKRILCTAFILSTSLLTCLAGGLVTNSNQSAAFLRNPARDGMIDIDGVYSNPAGVSFLSAGFHIGVTVQHPWQQRNVTTTFPTLALNASHLGQSTRQYKGQASAPVVPSIQAAYVWKNWTVSSSFAFSGGGGKCEFDEGIGSIESVLSLVPMQYGLKSYTYQTDSYMKGRQYYYGVQVGAGYKFNEHLSGFAGLRAVIGDATYTGYVRDIEYAPVNLPVADIEMTTDQKCLGWTPIIGLDYRINEHWNVAVKYEYRTRMNLKNESGMNDMARTQTALDKFNDQKTRYVRDDIPGTLTMGVQYSPTKTVRLNGAFHWYDDCNARKYNNEQKLIDHGTREFLAGAEWDVCKLLTVSAGWQNTHYSLSDRYMQDMSYNLSSNLVGAGVRLHLGDKVSMDLGYMHNFYQKRTVETVNYLGTGLTRTDTYDRRNDVVAVGVNVDI